MEDVPLPIIGDSSKKKTSLITEWAPDYKTRDFSQEAVSSESELDSKSPFEVSFFFF